MILFATLGILPIVIAAGAAAVMLILSGCFATPIGYQTNLMVKGPGRYNFMDFMKIGIPFKVIVGVPTVLIIYYLFG